MWHRLLGMLLICWTANPLTAAEAPGAVRVQIEAPDDECAGPVEVGVTPSPGGDLVPASTLPGPGLHDLEIEATGESWWLRHPRCWAQVELLETTSTRVVRFRLWPTVWIRGHLELEEPELEEPEFLGALTGRVALVASSTKLTEDPALDLATVSCEVEELTWRCKVPATPFDLRLESEGYAPVYFWNVRPTTSSEATETRDLGAVPLQPGASLVGWTDGSEGASAARLELVPHTLASSQARLGQRLTQLTTRTVQPEPDGFFQITGVPVGTYRLVGRRAGYSPLEIFPLRIEEVREHRLDDVVSLPLRALAEILLQPPLDPHLEPWQVELKLRKDAEPFTKAVAAFAASENGIWSQPDLDAGVYSLTIRDSRGDRFYSGELEVTPGMAPVQIALPLVELEGLLLLGDEPLPGRVVLKTYRGDSIRFETDEEGRFRGVLPERDGWRAEVFERSESPRRLMVDRVDIEPDAEGRAFTEIRLPYTRIHGVVVDEEGTGVDCQVTLVRGRTLLLQTRCDEEGGFEARGLEPGELTLQAEARGGRSDVQSIDLEEDAEGPEVRLVVRRERQVRLTLWLANRPVPGALVRYSDPAGRSQHGRQLTSMDGSILVKLHPETEFLDLVALAPGVPRKLERVGVRQKSVDLTLAGAGGELSLEMNAFPGGRPFLVQGPIVMPLAWALDESRDIHMYMDSAGVLHLPMEEGVYALCPEPRLTGDCHRGRLPLGGQLYLGRSPSSEPEEEPTESPTASREVEL